MAMLLVFGEAKDSNLSRSQLTVLTDNPLTDFANVKKIELRVKQGEPLQLGI
jgi:hypothetical protein